MPISEYLEDIFFMFGIIPDEIITFDNSIALDKHNAALIGTSNVIGCSKWSEMHDFANDLTDFNLAQTIFDEIQLDLLKGFKMLSEYVETSKPEKIDQYNVLFFAYKHDSETAPCTYLNRLYILNELARALEGEAYNGAINKHTLILSIIDQLRKENRLKVIVGDCFKLLSQLKCTLADLAERHYQFWDENSLSWLTE